MYIDKDEMCKFITDDISSKFGIMVNEDLYQLSYIVNRLDEGPILEIGSWLGKSSYAMSCHKNPKSILHLVDPFESDFNSGNPYPQAHLIEYYAKSNPNTPLLEVIKLQSMIYKNRCNLPAVKYVLSNFLSTTEFHKMRSENFELTFEPKFAFVDGGHEYHECYDDLDKILQYDNTLVAVHDYHQDSVKRACDDITKKYGRKSFVADNMYYILDSKQQYELLIIDLFNKLHIDL